MKHQRIFKFEQKLSRFDFQYGSKLISYYLFSYFLCVCVVDFDRTQFGWSPMNLYYYFLRKSFTTTNFNFSWYHRFWWTVFLFHIVYTFFFFWYCYFINIYSIMLLKQYVFWVVMETCISGRTLFGTYFFFFLNYYVFFMPLPDK